MLLEGKNQFTQTIPDEIGLQQSLEDNGIAVDQPGVYFNDKRGFLINGYSTKRLVDISINGVSESWCEVKNGGPFSVFFNREKNIWLKTVNDKEFDVYIEQSYLVQLSFLHLIGANYLADQCGLVEISSVDRDSTKIGFISPHFGETIQSVLKSKKRGNDVSFSDDDLNWFYYQGFVLARELLATSGWWIDDPNSGNIVLPDSTTNNNEIILIDFSSKNSTRRYNPINVNELEKSFDHDAKKAGLNGWRRNV